MKIFWTILAVCYPKSAFEQKIALATTVERLTVEKGKIWG
jgi:hypothetical protein